MVTCTGGAATGSTAPGRAVLPGGQRSEAVGSTAWP